MLEPGELPAKWCVKARTEEQETIVNKYARSLPKGKHWTTSNNHAKIYYLHIANGEYHSGRVLPEFGHIEISFERFEELVLNKKSKPKIKVIEDLTYLILIFNQRGII